MSTLQKVDSRIIYDSIYDIMRVVIDTNVLISALYSRRGASYALLKECFSGGITYAVCPLVALEYEGKICEKIEDGFLRLLKEDCDKILDAFLARAVIVWKPLLERPRLIDPSDDKILECAISGACTHIVTFNTRHFPVSLVGNFGIKVTTPRDFLKEWRTKV